MQERVRPGGVKLAPGSALVVEGPDVRILDLEVEGALVVRAVPGAKVIIDGLRVKNDGWAFEPLAEGEAAPEELAIRCAAQHKVGI